MSLASIASKAIMPGVLIPIGLVTALIGVPFFVALDPDAAGTRDDGAAADDRQT